MMLGIDDDLTDAGFAVMAVMMLALVWPATALIFGAAFLSGWAIKRFSS